jgi:hypothetical protein
MLESQATLKLQIFSKQLEVVLRQPELDRHNLSVS